MKKNETEIETEQATENAETGAEPVVAVVPESITPEQLDELKQRAAKADEHWDRLLRSIADFDNFKKRAARERQEAIKFANEGLLEKLIPVLDNFDMALSAAQTAQSAQADVAQSLQTGINMIYQQFKTVLQDVGLEEVDAQGKKFDPNLHEAISQQETPEVPEGQVVHQVRKGYKLRERLLRPASVVVAKQPA